jgi:hypothetical protein
VPHVAIELHGGAKDPEDSESQHQAELLRATRVQWEAEHHGVAHKTSLPLDYSWGTLRYTCNATMDYTCTEAGMSEGSFAFQDSGMHRGVSRMQFDATFHTVTESDLHPLSWKPTVPVDRYMDRQL